MGTTALEVLVLPVCRLTVEMIAAGALIRAVKSITRRRPIATLSCHRAPTPRKDRA
jgi:hypothetical protein